MAGIAKLLDPRGSREAARAFGVPSDSPAPWPAACRSAEIAIAVLLLPVATRWYAALAALVLLLAFCVAIASGHGPWGSARLPLLRAAPLGAGGLVDARADRPARSARRRSSSSPVATIRGRASSPGSSELDGDRVARAGARGRARRGRRRSAATRSCTSCAATARCSSASMRWRSRLRAAGFELEEPDDIPELGLEPGTPAPDFALASIDGRASLARTTSARAGNPVLLLFTSPTCGPCSHLMPTVAEWQREHADELTVALVSAGDAEAVRADAAEHGLANVLVDTDLATYEAYEANGTPSAVLIGDDGTSRRLARRRERLDRVARPAGARRARPDTRAAGGHGTARAAAVAARRRARSSSRT